MGRGKSWGVGGEFVERPLLVYLSEVIEAISFSMRGRQSSLGRVADNLVLEINRMIRLDERRDLQI